MQGYPATGTFFNYFVIIIMLWSWQQLREFSLPACLSICRAASGDTQFHTGNLQELDPNDGIRISYINVFTAFWKLKKNSHFHMPFDSSLYIHKDDQNTDA
jgi:hypothetical protein